MFEAFIKACGMYKETYKVTVSFSIFALLSLSMMLFLSSYLAAGAGMIRFSSIRLDMTLTEAVFFAAVSLASTALFSITLASVISITKLKETLDQSGFAKIINVFPDYVLRVFIFLVIMTVATVAVAAVASFVNAPPALAQFVLLVLWALFLFSPQVIVLEDYPVLRAMADSKEFVAKHPGALLEYLLIGFVLLILVLVIETVLGQFLFFEHNIVSVLIVSLVVLPLTQMYASELYLTRYPLAGI